MIDVSPLMAGVDHIADVATEIDRACRDFGFFYIEGHGVDEDLQQRMDAAGRAFFALPDRGQGRDRHGPRWPGLAGLVPVRG